MVRFYDKRKEAETWPGSICPKIRKRIEKNIELSATCMVSGAGDGIFQVDNRNRTYIVDMKEESCTCKRWDLVEFHVTMQLHAADMRGLILRVWCTPVTV